MKVLVAGDWHSSLHEEVFANAIEALGHEVSRFAWYPYFHGEKSSLLISPWRKLQNKFIIGPLLRRINDDFFLMVMQLRPDLVFVYRGTHITPTVLRKIKDADPRIILVGYNNDDPFAPGHPPWLWRYFVAGIPAYDLVLAYRHRNLGGFLNHGARHVGLLRSWFVPELHRPVHLTAEERARYSCDVVFVGHYESDGRLEMLEAIVQNGFQVKVFGPGCEWDAVLKKSSVLRQLPPISLVWNEEYTKALCGAKIALCFLSKLNRDTYTRRCFEIPATSTMMLSEYSDDLSEMFTAGVEADFFRSKEELVSKIRMYIANDGLRKAIGERGLVRVFRDGHDVRSRAQHCLKMVNKIQKPDDFEV